MRVSSRFDRKRAGTAALPQHPSLGATSVRPQLFISLMRGRLAVHYDYSVTQLIEELAASRECAVAAKPSGKALERSRAAGHEDGSFPICMVLLSAAFLVPDPYDLPPGHFSRGLAARMIV
jgi:hypothetical protein